MDKSRTPSPPKPRLLQDKGLLVKLSDLNPHFLCVLCFGYFVNATTITECMHTFCRSCIVNFLRSNRHCPRCDALLSKSRPFNSLRADTRMQSLVYKTIPGLFQTEMRRRVEFYQSHPHQDSESDVQALTRHIFAPEDSISLAISSHKFSEDEGSEGVCPVRYFRCPAAVPVSVLKLLVKTKYGVPEPFRVELLYRNDRLLESWTLMDVAYIYDWQREDPMELTFQVLTTRKIKKRKPRSFTSSFDSKSPDSSSEGSPKNDDIAEPPEKILKVEENSSETDDTFIVPDDQSSFQHPRPPTPPETPDSPSDCATDDITRLSKDNPSFEERVAAEVLERLAKESRCSEEEEESRLLESEDQDSETPLEVDTSHEMEVEESDKILEEEDSAIDVTDATPSEQNDSDGRETDLNISSESIEEHEKRDNEENNEKAEERDETGALDLSHHARTVREARAHKDYSDSLDNSSVSPSLSIEEGLNNSKEARGKGTQTILSITQNRDKEGVKLPHGSIPLSSPVSNPAFAAWVRPPLLPGHLTPHAASFPDLITLSHAAAQIQLAMAHAQAQVQAQKAQADMLKNLKVSESLSFVNGSGDTLTISPIAPSSSADITKSKSPLKLGQNAGIKHHMNSKNTLNRFSLNKGIANTNITKNITRSTKCGMGQKFANSCPKNLANSSLRIPSVPSNKTNNIKKLEKDKKERTGDPVFKITNQKLAEFVRQQHLNNKLKQNNNNNSIVKTSNGNVGLSVKASSPVSQSPKSSPPKLINSKPVVTNSSPISTQATSAKISLPSANKSSTTQPVEKVSTTGINCKTTSTPNKETSSPPPSSTTINKSPITKKSCVTSSTLSTSTIRTTNTSVRQIPNPSLLHQQSESRLSAGLGALISKRNPKSGAAMRLENLTRSLHEKVAASTMAANAAAVNSAAR